jgi:hypothetical protein
VSLARNATRGGNEISNTSIFRENIPGFHQIDYFRQICQFEIFLLTIARGWITLAIHDDLLFPDLRSPSMFLNLWRRIVNQRIRASRRAHPSFYRPKAVTFRPQVESIEDRILLSIVNWLPGSGDWSDPNHWLDASNQTHHVPTAGDDAVISTGDTVMHTAGADAAQSISLSSGSLLLIDGSLDVSGTLSGDGAYTLEGGTLANATVASGTTITGTFSGGTLDGVTLTGILDLTADIGTYVEVRSGLTINGTANLGASDGSTFGYILFTDTQTVSGTGSIVFGGSTTNFLQIDTASATVTLGPSLTAHGKNGVFTVSNPASDAWVNQGAIAADVSGGNIAFRGAWTNSGTIQAQNGGSLTTFGAFSNSGNVTVGNGSRFTAGANYIQTAGTTRLNGGTLAASTLVDIQGGILAGTGTINADVQNAGLLTIGDSTTPGILTIIGNFTQTSAGTLAVKIGGVTTPGTDFDQLVISPGFQATLRGTLQVTLFNGYTPVTGDSVMIMTFDSATGTFEALTGDGGLFMATYDPTDVTLIAT